MTARTRSRLLARSSLLGRFGLLAPLAALSLAGCGINSVPTAEENVNAKWANVQSEYQRRNDLIGNLVETVKGAAAQERACWSRSPRRDRARPRPN